MKKIKQNISEKDVYNLSDFFKNFGDSTRLKIVLALLDGELCVSDIAEKVGSTGSAVSHQLRVLKSAKIIKSQRDGRLTFYSIDDDHVSSVLKVGLAHILEDNYGK